MLRSGKVYKIICSQTNDVYVGSTFNELRIRLRQHKYQFKQWVDEKSNEVSIYPYFETHGIENFKIILIKEYKVVDKDHLHAYEQLWINKLNPINKNNPFCIKKLYKKEWAKLNSDKVQASRANRQLQINERNKEKLTCECGVEVSRRNQSAHRKSQQHLRWIQESNETEEDRQTRLQAIADKELQQKKRTADRQKKYREKNNESIKASNAERFQCPCGLEIQKKKKNRHEKTKKHQTWLSSQ